MSEYQDKEEVAWWHELKRVYPELAPPDERTAEERKQDAEQAKDDLFGPERKETANADQRTDRPT